MNKIEFEYEGVWITKPHYDETGRFEVEPKEYYGKVYLEKYLFKYGSTLQPSEFDELIKLIENEN